MSIPLRGQLSFGLTARTRHRPKVGGCRTLSSIRTPVLVPAKWVGTEKMNKVYKMTNDSNNAIKIEPLEDAIPADDDIVNESGDEREDLRLVELPDAVMVPYVLQDQSGWRSENLEQWLSAEPPAMESLFNDIFPAGIAAGLCGAGGVGKSTFILQLSYSLATGVTVFPAFVPTEPRRVMIFLGEDPKNVTWRRIWNIAKRFPLSPEEKALLLQNLHVFSHRAEKLYTMEDGKVSPTEAYTNLLREVSRIRPGLLIIDPKSRWSAGNENSNDEATAFVELLEGLILPHGASLLLTHHVSKAGQGSLSATGVRGASAFVDALRLVFSMVSTGKGDEGDEDISTVLLNTSKSNFTPRLPKPIGLRHCDEFGGALEQVEEGCGMLDLLGIAHTLSKWLAENGPINMSAIFDPRDDRAIELHQLLAEKLFHVNFSPITQA